MAIYKPTYCEPFLSTEDFTTITASNPLYLYCKIASSNFDVTGYRIRLLGPNNEQQFPPVSQPETSLRLDSISFIEDLKLLPLNPDPSNPDTNSGRNGTFLKIPFYVGNGSTASNTVSRNQINNNTLTLYNGNDYKWIITLYQLEKVTGGSGDNRYRIPTNVNYYDIILTSGVIVGSTPKRIQTIPSDKILSDYYIQPVQISNLQTTAQSNLVSERATSWTHSGDITPVGSRGRIYTYDNMLGHLYPQLAVEGAWENVINRTLWLAGTDGIANGIQVFKQSGNWDDLQTTQKADMMPYGAIPWTWVMTPANLGQSYGRQEYWITKDNYNNNPDTYYPFDTEKNITITSSGFTTQAQGNLGNDAQPPVCLNNNVWYTISNHTLYMTSNGGQSFSSVTFASTQMNSLVQRVFNLPYKDTNNETHNRLWVLAGSSLTDPTTPYQLYAKNVDVQSSSWVECGTVFETTDDDDENLSSAQFIFPEPIYNEETRGWNYWYGCSTQHGAYAAQQKYNIYIGRITASVDIGNAVERYEKGDYYPSDNEYYLQMPSAIRNASWGGLKGFVAAPYWGELSLSIYGGTMNLPSVTTVWNIPGDESQNYHAIPLWVFTPQTTGDPRRVVYERRPDGTETTPLPYCSLFTTSARNISTIKSYAFGGSVSVSQGVVTFNTSSLGYQLCLVGESASGSGTSLRYILSFYDSSSLSLTQQTDVCGWGFCSLSSVVYNLPSIVYCYKNGQEFSSLSGTVHAPVYSTPLQTTSNSVVSVMVFGGVSNVFYLTTNGTDWTTKLTVQNDSNTWTGISCVYYTQQTYAFRGILTSSETTGITGSVYIDAIITGDNPAQKTFNGPPVTEKMRIILNYQPDSASFDWASNTIPAPFAGDSRYNGIYSPEFTVEFYDGALAKLKSYDEAVYVKVIVYWRRTIDADTWGELLNKIVMIDPNSVYSSDGIGNDWAGQNVQINVEPENNNGGVLNTTPFKFVAEKPIKLYELDETNNSDINTTAIIFYNNPTAVAKEIVPANTLFLRPLNNLENGNIIKFINTDSWSAVCYQDNTVWSVQTTTPQALLPIPSAIEESKTPYSINSFFRTSDENPFSGAANPDIEITYNIVGHRVDCSAQYTQDTFVQWRTYQWSLTSADGTEVYDQTPVGYDNEIKATFYGLKSGATYKIVLTIETNDNRVFTEEATVTMPAGDLYQADWLAAEADCNGYYTDSETGDLGSNVVTINTHGRAGDLYKCEIWPTGEGEEPIYHLVGEHVGPLVKDYNVANHRWYKYVFRYEDGNDYVIPIQTSWAGWTLTELAPVGKYGHLLSYTAESTGVWKFKYNVSAGSQTQNLSKTSHDTLGRFPYFSFGRTNYESGSVTCLLGREMIPYNLAPNKSQYVYKDGQWTWEYVDATGLPSQSQIPYLRGGYTERLPNNQSGFRDLGSNEKINMLNQWKQFCASGNPKLLKDEKGNAYIVQILNTSSETQNNVYGRPEQISFEWHQIADTKSYVIQATEGVVDSHMFTFGANLRQEEQGVFPSDYLSWTLTKQDGSTVSVGTTPDSEIPVVYNEIKSFEISKEQINVKLSYTLNGVPHTVKIENPSWDLTLTGSIVITKIEYVN